MRVNKILVIVCLTVVGMRVNAWAMDFEIFNMRNKIFDESKEIKALIKSSTDVVLLTVMFDSCFVTMSQLDSYFVMLAIYDTIPPDAVSPQALDALIGWLNEIKKMDNLSVSALGNLTIPVDQATRPHVDRLIGYFTDLNTIANDQLRKMDTLKKTLKKPGGK